MKILYLVDKNYHDSKMSRVRFHSMKAVGDLCDLLIHGPNWPGWNDNFTVQENIEKLNDIFVPDIVVGFKPLDLKGFKDITYPKCVRYNEMYDIDWTVKEIVGSGANLIICHHENDYLEYKNRLGEVKSPYPFKFVNIPHSAEKTIFKPMPEVEKEFDVLIVGATKVQTMLGSHYPLRERMCDLIHKLPNKYKVGIKSHVGGNHNDAHTDKYAVDFAKSINSARIVITDSGAPKSRFGKYIEIPMCGVGIAGDIPDEHQEQFREFVIEIDMEMDDYEILEEIVRHLEDKEMLANKIKKGLEYTSMYTQEKYAERFIKEVETFLGEYYNGN